MFIRDVYTVSYWMWEFIKDGNTVSFVVAGYGSL